MFIQRRFPIFCPQLARIAAFASFGLLLAFCGCGKADDARTVKTRFIDDAILDEKEIATVLQLAKQCGIAEPGEIQSYHALPGSHRSVNVVSVERVNGRQITYDLVNVGCAKWGGQEWMGKNPKQLGKFWVSSSHFYTVKCTTFNIDGRTVRVSLDEGIPLTLADKIIDAFTHRRIEDDFAYKFTLEHTDVSSPSQLKYQKGKNEYEIHFLQQSISFVFQLNEIGQIKIDGVGSTVF